MVQLYFDQQNDLVVALHYQHDSLRIYSTSKNTYSTTVQYIPCKNFYTKLWWLVKPKNVGTEIHKATKVDQIPSQNFSHLSFANYSYQLKTHANLCLLFTSSAKVFYLLAVQKTNLTYPAFQMEYIFYYILFKL